MMKEKLKENLDLIRERIDTAGQMAGGRERPVLIAVTKFQPIEKIHALYEMGQRDIGENYVQELIAKARTLKEKGITDIQWHFIGHLQTNKVKMLLQNIENPVIHTVDSLKLAREINKRWHQLGRTKPLSVFLEINIDRESNKAGLLPEEEPILELCREMANLKSLKLKGLMCIPSPKSDPASSFRALAELERKCRPYTEGGLSMGMSQDFEVAIQEGATHIRVGTLLVGPRPEAQ